MPFPVTTSSGGTALSGVIVQANVFAATPQAVYYNGTSYQLAIASSATTSEFIGFATSSTSTQFTFITSGLVSGFVGLTPGEVYWLSDTVAGAITTTQPTAVSSVSKPVFIAVSATSGYIENYADTAPAIGQTAVVEYVNVYRSTNLSVANNAPIIFNQTLSGNIPYNTTTGRFTLSAGKTYKLSGNVTFNDGGSGMSNAWYNVTGATTISPTGQQVTGDFAGALSTNQAEVIFTPSVNTEVELRNITGGTRNVTGSAIGSASAASQASIIQIGASPVPMDLAGEYGENNAIVNGATFGTTLVDITGSSFILPTAGTWDVEYAIFGANNTPSNGTVGVYDASNVLVPNSTSNVGIQGSNGLVSVQTTQKVTITTTSAATYKLKGQTAAGAITVANLSTLGINSSGNSKITWRKISGFVPSSGQTVDFVNVYRTTSQTVANNSAVLFDQTLSGNIPYNSATGRFTLTAGKTYKLGGNILINETATNINTVWYNATGATTISPSGNNAAGNFGGVLGANQAEAIFTPTVTTEVELRNVTGASRIIAGTPFGTGPSGASQATIVQLGSSAVIAGVYSSVFTNYTPTIGITSGVAPVLPTSAVVQGSYTIQGKTMLLNLKYFAASVTGGSDGSGGSYSFSIPAGYVIDTTKAIPPSVLTNTGGSGLDAVSVSIGSGYGRNSTGGNSSGLAVFALSSTTIGAYFEAQTRLIGPGALAMTGASNTLITMSCQIPLV